MSGEDAVYHTVISSTLWPTGCIKGRWGLGEARKSSGVRSGMHPWITVIADECKSQGILLANEETLGVSGGETVEMELLLLLLLSLDNTLFTI